MVGSVLSFLKAEWKMSDTGSAHWVSSFTFCLYYLINPYTLLNFMPKIVVVFRADLHKMKINTELCCKRYDFLTKKTQNYRYQNYCPGWQYSNLFIWPSMWTRLEHAHCLETINNMWFLGKRETVNAWKKADFDGFRDKEE